MKILATLLIAMTTINAQAQKGIRFAADEPHQRIDITIDGAPFTSYIWPTTLKKPTLFPLIAPGGITVTRGFPLAPQPGERTDHPHHAGMWFNYGNVNGFDFWNNSDAIKPADRAKMGTIYQRRIVSTKSGADSGELVVESVWIDGTGKELLKDSTRYVFSARTNPKDEARIIDQITTLTALDRAVFHDDKEGMLGMRVASFLESPNEKAQTFTDANGRATTVGGAGSTASGVYLTSEGKQGEAAWGTRGTWCTLSGTTDNHPITIAILDHPSNPGTPTYWHARGYGLFAANPLGQKIFDPTKPALDFALEKGASTTFRYRVILMNHPTTPALMNKEEAAFSSLYR